MITLPEGLPPSLYPLGMFAGQFAGEGMLGGHFGAPETGFEQKISWVPRGDELVYSNEIRAGSGLILAEKGLWKIASERPEALTDEGMFPVQAEIETTLFRDLTGDLGEAGKTALSGAKSGRAPKEASWRCEYVGLVGYGKAEIVSDKIELLAPAQKIGSFEVNDLWRSKRMFGYVHSQILWAWDIALHGAEKGLQSLAAGGFAG